MASSNLRKCTNPSFLRTLEFNNLICLLKKFDDYFTNIVKFDYNVSQEDFNYEELANILINQFMVGQYSELFNALALIGAMGADSREDILREYIDLQPYCFEATDDMSISDLALLIYLHNPEILNQLDIQFSATRKKSFAMRVATTDISNLEITQEKLDALESLLNQAFIGHHRGKTAKVYTPKLIDEQYVFIIRHGDSFKRQGTVEKEKESRTLAFQPESFDTLYLNVKTGELRICVPAEPEWLETCYALSLGQALFDNFSTFDRKRYNNLERIKELKENILVYPGETEIQNISLVGLKFMYSPGSSLVNSLSESNGNLLRELEYEHYDIANAGKIIEAKFVINFGNKEMTIVLKNNNRSGYDYDESGIVVDDWLRFVGIISPINDNEVLL